ncbi:histidine kinase [Rhodoferax koreense]|uniref:histidine kinase n=1 Tax=Rhodoferax koreensis TaxID=1842727 RepID=A0A1P8JWP8_9BURK|nr:ATP-binding protein [Rhodoferax koreense]APW38186.1 histidine kinase [Rhodoferax koreense]
MTDPIDTSQTANDVVPRAAEELLLRLSEKERELDELRAELDETNRGVLALYAELESQADDLKRATELKSRFLAYMSHEFRTPIGAILSIARILQDRLDGPLTEEQERQVGFIQKTATEFSDMVDDLLDLAKVEAGRIDVSPAWFDMVDLFSALRGMFKPVLVNPEVTLIFEEPVGVPKLFADDRKLAQILRNFISNALKFTQKGEIRVAARRSGDEVTFSVSDTGIGIAPEFHHAIFQDYSQIDSPIQKRLRGTGLGLSLSKRLAELLGGRVEVTSELQKGSCFCVTIPVAAPRSDASDAGGSDA